MPLAAAARTFSFDPTALRRRNGVQVAAWTTMQQRAREVVGRSSLPNADPAGLQEVGAAWLGLFQNAFEGLELAAHVSSNATRERWVQDARQLLPLEVTDLRKASSGGSADQPVLDSDH